METASNSLVMRKSVFAWIAAGTCSLLLIPLIAMQFTSEVNWGVGDFVLMGLLLFTSASVFVLVGRIVPRSYRLALGAGIMITFLYVWAELAVGIFTNLGS